MCHVLYNNWAPIHHGFNSDLSTVIFFNVNSFILISIIARAEACVFFMFKVCCVFFVYVFPVEMYYCNKQLEPIPPMVNSESYESLKCERMLHENVRGM